MYEFGFAFGSICHLKGVFMSEETTSIVSKTTNTKGSGLRSQEKRGENHDLKKHAWQKPHQPNLTGTKSAYYPNKNRNAIEKKYKSWKD